jgi:hypothetical protein
MHRITVEGGYPVWVEEIAKADTPWLDVDEIAAALQAYIRRSGASAFIGIFDYYGLNLRVGELLPNAMQDAKLILFCLGANLLNPTAMALCPYAIGVADMGNRFVISFPDASVDSSTKNLAQWVEDLRTTDIPSSKIGRASKNGK